MKTFVATTLTALTLFAGAAVADDPIVLPLNQLPILQAQLSKDLLVLNVDKANMIADMTKLAAINADLKSLNAQIATAIKLGDITKATQAQLSLEADLRNKAATAAFIAKNLAKVAADNALVTKDRALRDALLKKK